MAGIEIDLNSEYDSPEDLQKVFDALEKGETPEPPAEPKAEEPPAEPVKTEPAAVEPQEEQPGQNAEDNAEGVATRDGKHIIPYSVLKGERERASRAEQIAREAQERIAALEAQVAAGNQGANNGEPARTDPDDLTDDELSPEDLESLKEDFPTVYKAVLKAQRLEAQMKPVTESVRSTEQERQQAAAETVQEAIDSNPKLAHIQASSPEAFDLAKQFDATLRGQAAWQGKPLAERFAKVTEMVESALGPIALPGAAKPTPTPEELAATAKAAAEKAAKANRSDVPVSLSDFPAGRPPASDEAQAVEAMSHQQLSAKLAAMTPEEMDAYFANL
ncbi:MAG: hypothetical protein WC997_02395 [Porticoccaceae bacterium]